MARHAAFGARRHLVADADVGEGAPHHDLVVAAARAEAVKVARADLVGLQIVAGRAVFLDDAGRGDVVGRYRIAQPCERAGADDIFYRTRFGRHALKIGRVADVGAGRIPIVGQAAGDLDGLPVRIALEDIGIALAEHGRRHAAVDGLGDFAVGRPDILEIDIVAGLVLADRIGIEIDPERPGERIGDDQRRRGQIVALGQRVDAAFEIAVAG